MKNAKGIETDHILGTYTHDCTDCRFLGTVYGPNPRMAVKNPPFVIADLYFCERADGGSVIARHSSNGPDYCSSPVKLLHKDSNPELLWARAILEMEKMAK